MAECGLKGGNSKEWKSGSEPYFAGSQAPAPNGTSLARRHGLAACTAAAERSSTMEEHEQQERKPLENWNGQERRHGSGDDYKGDERRKAMKEMPSGDLTGGDPDMSEAEQ